MLISGCETVKDQREIPPMAMDHKVFEKVEIIAQNLYFNSESGEIGYTLPEDAYVRIRLGIRDGGPMLTHFVDWEYRTKGPHVEKWDGKIEGVNGDLRGRPDLMLNFFAVSAEEPVRKTPKFTISFPESQERSDLGLPLIRGVTPLRLTVAPEDEHWLSTRRYEIAMFIDQIFLMEEEEGMSPFTYYLDTSKMSDGVHSLAVNVVSYEGDAAAVNLLVLVDNKKTTK